MQRLRRSAGGKNCWGKGPRVPSSEKRMQGTSPPGHLVDHLYHDLAWGTPLDTNPEGPSGDSTTDKREGGGRWVLMAWGLSLDVS